MLPPPSPAGQPVPPDKQPAGVREQQRAGLPEQQRAGLVVLLVALVVLLGLVALVWWINEEQSDDDPWRSGRATAIVAASPT